MATTVGELQAVLTLDTNDFQLQLDRLAVALNECATCFQKTAELIKAQKAELNLPK